MVYEILLKQVSAAPDDVETIFDNPYEARDAFESLRDSLGPDAVTLLRDKSIITAAQLAADIESYEIQAVREADTQLPPTYRHGWGRDSDLALGSDGQTHGVWKPDNPENDYE
jgi:hypothetical protein